MSRTILLADDSATIRKIVELTLDATEFLVETVDSGAAALQRFDSERPDLVVADIGMPRPSGYDVCRHVKRSDHPVPVLLLVGAFDTLDEERAIHCGSDGHLTKPFESETLLTRLRDLVASCAPAPAGSVEQADAGDSRSVDGIDVDVLARAVAERLTLDVVREVAAEVVPRVAERVVRERIRRLEARQDREGA